MMSTPPPRKRSAPHLQRLFETAILVSLAWSTGAYYDTSAPPPELLELVMRAGKDCMDEDGVAAHGHELEYCLQGRLPPKVLKHEAYSEFVRNFSCSVDDAGTQPVRIEHLRLAAVPRCVADPIAPPPEPLDQYARGPLPAGNDLWRDEVMTVAEAQRRCSANLRCAGLTFQGLDPDANGHPARVWFKSVVSGRPVNTGGGWHTYYRKQSPLPEPCLPTSVQLPEGYDVEVFRDRPMLLIRVRSFVTDDECDALVAAGGDFGTMKQAHTSYGHSTYRRSWSLNIQPDLRNNSSPITQLVVRLFAVARQLLNASLHPAGQEPLNAVLYRSAGDEYRQHSDGRSGGGKFHAGERIMTAIVPCITPDAGGQTTFMRGSLKFVHQRLDMLFFAYRDGEGRMDPHKETLHSGCPLRAGTKYIITQWFREGVDEERTWEGSWREGEEFGGRGKRRGEL